MFARDNKLERFLESDTGHEILGVLVLINAAILGLETFPSLHGTLFLEVLRFLDKTILGVFLVELILRIYASGFSFFKKGWNLFDTFIILLALLPSVGVLSVLRALRILRVMRLISLFPNMRLIVAALVNAVPGILSVASLLLLSFYVASIIAFNLFSYDSAEHFGSLRKTMFTLFQLMLGDDWGATVHPLLEHHPYGFLFFIPFMILMTFTVLNLFFGLIVNSMQSAAESENKTAEEADPLIVLETELADVKKQLHEIKILVSR